MPHPAATSELDAMLELVATGPSGEALHTQLAGRHPEREWEEIEDAIQTACACFIDEVPRVEGPGAAYAWIRKVADRRLNRERALLERQPPTDLSGTELNALAADAPTPEQQAIEREDEIDVADLAATVVSILSERQRDVLALYGAGYKRPEIANRLGITHRVVKRELLDIFEHARTNLARRAGGGCTLGEALVLRFVCGLASDVEASQAQLHIDRCECCAQFHERLNLWREKVGAVLPAPLSEQADPGVLERTLHKAIDGASALRQHVLDGSAQIKQQATTTYYRAADPTPLAGARPGAVAAVVAGCLAVGTGTYTCVEQGINPLMSLPGVGEPAPEQRATTPPETTPAEETPVPPPTPVVVESAPTPESSAAPAPAPVEPVEPAPQPPPEQSFEPSSRAYSPPASQQSSTPATPAPVADGGGGSSEFEP
jgi:RNA polymerase sigma factor (sigma-70 family)